MNRVCKVYNRRCFAFGAGAAIGIIILGEAINLALAVSARKLEPLCDGEFTDEEHIESDGFITVYCSGPIRPIPKS